MKKSTMAKILGMSFAVALVLVVVGSFVSPKTLTYQIPVATNNLDLGYITLSVTYLHNRDWYDLFDAYDKAVQSRVEVGTLVSVKTYVAKHMSDELVRQLSVDENNVESDLEIMIDAHLPRVIEIQKVNVLELDFYENEVEADAIRESFTNKHR